VKEYSTERRRPRVQTVNDKPSMTVQSDVVRTEIRHVLAKYRQTGLISRSSMAPVEFGSDVGFATYADAHAALERAAEEFLKLPPEIRLELGNDPGRYAEISSEDGWRRVVERIGAKERRRIEQAQLLVARHTPSQAGPTGKSDGAPKSSPPEGGTPRKE